MRKDFRKETLVLLTIIACSLLVAVGLASFLVPQKYSARDIGRLALTEGVSRGIVRDRVVLSIPLIQGGLNTIDLKLRPLSASSQTPQGVALEVCGVLDRELVLSSETVVSVTPPTGCRPVSISIAARVSAPGISTSESGVRVESISIRSVIGVPLASWTLLLPTITGIVALVSLSMLLATARGISAGISGFGALVICALFMISTRAEPEKLVPLTLFTVAVQLGLLMRSAEKGRCASVSSIPCALFWLAVLGGASIRFYGIKFGLPGHFHPDEVTKVRVITRMIERDTLNPHYFLHPSLLLYCTYFTTKFLQLVGALSSIREDAFLAGRLVSATAGTVSIALTYHVGKRLFSREVGGVASCLLAVLPLHVTCSRYLKEDALLTCMVLLTVLVTISAIQGHRRWLLLIAGLLAGCTAGAKYSGIVIAMVPAAAPWIASRRWLSDRKWLPWACGAICLAPLGFLVTTPYSLLNETKFLADFARESHHMQNGHTVPISAWSQLWMYHFWRSLWPGMSGIVTFLSCVAGAFLLRRRRPEDLLLVGLILLFYLPAEYVKAKPAPQPERYILPCLPFLAIATAELLRSVVARTGFFAASAVFLVLTPLVRSVALARDITDDTRTRMARWMVDNLPHGSKVVMDWKAYGPQFRRKSFQIEYLPRSRQVPNVSLSSLRAQKADYLVLSNLFYNRILREPGVKEGVRERFRVMMNQLPKVAEFSAPSGTYGFHNPRLTLFSLKEQDQTNRTEGPSRQLPSEGDEASDT